MMNAAHRACNGTGQHKPCNSLALQVSLAQKDALLNQLAQQKAAMEARLGLTGEVLISAMTASRESCCYLLRWGRPHFSVPFSEH
jgi:hypothetical protein